MEFGWSAERSLRTGKYLYIQAPRRKLYDQEADPTANHDLASSSAAVADTLASQLETFRQKTVSQQETPRVAVDPAAQQNLRALDSTIPDHFVRSDQGLSGKRSWIDMKMGCHEGPTDQHS
jgi:hypothetical protein